VLERGVSGCGTGQPTVLVLAGRVVGGHEDVEVLVHSLLEGRRIGQEQLDARERDQDVRGLGGELLGAQLAPIVAVERRPVVGGLEISADSQRGRRMLVDREHALGDLLPALERQVVVAAQPLNRDASVRADAGPDQRAKEAHNNIHPGTLPTMLCSPKTHLSGTGVELWL
jgi:hypothetical protein